MPFNHPSQHFCLRLTLLLLPLLLASGCVSNVINVKGEDGGAAIHTAQISFPIGNDSDIDETPEISFPPTERIKLRSSRVSGDFSQNIPSGKIVDFEDYTFSGPDRLNGSSTIDFSSLSIGADSISKALRASFYFGVSYVEMDLKLDGAAQYAHTSDSYLGSYLDVGLYWQANPQLYAGAQITQMLHLSGSTMSSLLETDLCANYQFTPNVAVMAGYRWWEYEYGIDEYDSGIKLNLSGPFLGLDLRF